MLLAGFKRSVLGCLIFLLLPSAPLQAQPFEGDPFEELLGTVRLIEKKVKKIEEAQQEILNRQEKILKELDSLRIWVARR